MDVLTGDVAPEEMPSLVIVAEPVPPQYIYNTADAYEQDPEILRAEVMFFNTPQVQTYSSQAYYALKNVQDQCQYDHAKFCGGAPMFADAQVAMESLFRSSIPFAMARRLDAETKSQLPPGRRMLEYLRSYYVPSADKESQAIVHHKLTKENLAKLQTALDSGKEKKSSTNKPSSVQSHVMYKGKHERLPSVRERRNLRHDDEAIARPEPCFFAPQDANVGSIEPAVVTDAAMPPLALYDPAPMVSPPFMGLGGIYMNSRPAVMPAQDIMMVDPPNVMVDPPMVHPRMDPGFDGGFERRAGPPDGRRPPPDDRRPPPPDDRPERPDRPDGPPPDRRPPHHRRDDDTTPSEDGSSSDGGSSEGGWDGNDHHHDHHHGHHHHDERPALDDQYFPGALGFGAAGDVCLYENVQSLSQPCVQAVSDLYTLRESYWESYTTGQDSASHHGGGFIVVLMIVFVVVMIKKFMRAPRRKHMRMFLESLNKNPELKARVESELGVSVPAATACCGGDRRTLCTRICKALAIFCAAFFASMFISITALELTAASLNSIETTQNEPASPAVVLLLLLTYVVLEVVALVALVKGVKYVYNTWHRAPEWVEAQQGSGSAPPAPLVSYPTASSSSSNGTVGGGAPVYVSSPSWYETHVSPRLATWSQYFAQSRGHAGDGYRVLREDDREMIAVGGRSTHGGSAPPASYAVYTAVPPQQHTVVTAPMYVNAPIAARPVTAVHLV